jgi:transglutaminase-like putative cysteine protease
VKYKVTHTTEYQYNELTAVCHNLVHLTPRRSARQRCQDFRLEISPEPAHLASRQDYFGNQSSYFSIQQSHQGLSVTASSRVTLAPVEPVEATKSPGWETIRDELPSVRTPEWLDACQYVFESPCVKGSAELAAYAAESFPAGRPVLEAVADLNRRIHADFRYDPQATSVTTPVHEVFRHRHGVCQDFAHAAIGCLRSLGLAARYVSGYLRTVPPPGKPRLVGADASHAWFAVYAGTFGWVDFDPTNNLLVDTDHITLAWGRDYSDVAPVRGVFVGAGHHAMTVSVDVEPQDE